MSIFLRAHLLHDGFSEKEVRRLRSAGHLCSIRRGAYVHGPPPDDAVERHVLLVRAALPHLNSQAVVSHVSAAVLHGLPLWGLGLDRVHVTRPGRRRGGRCHPLVHVRTNTLDPAEVVVIDGIPVTSIERTVVDLARAVPFTQAVVAADGALARDAFDVQRAWGLLGEMKRWPGAPAARRVLEFADGRSESVGESRSRVLIAAAGLPDPVLQWNVPGTGFETDFGWEKLRTVGEFDGRVKYGRLLKPGQDPGDVVFEEKRREDAIRDTGLAVVRWTWAELDEFGAVAQRLRRRFRPG
ncbi:type IV toxin-antitoxin system AbiEi family antitoxin domain-containing protein [Pseudonocardia sp. CA-107938]|uniref:type IV toxin-antitoxin system AbiEi family antitoxin domain-containing protein n=1 Tax=Pseudonocardia sp. CA-107938 TaxID=3240021 RepID=UPI003D8B0B68